MSFVVCAVNKLNMPSPRFAVPMYARYPMSVVASRHAVTEGAEKVRGESDTLESEREGGKKKGKAARKRRERKEKETRPDPTVAHSLGISAPHRISPPPGTSTAFVSTGHRIANP